MKLAVFSFLSPYHIRMYLFWGICCYIATWLPEVCLTDVFLVPLLQAPHQIMHNAVPSIFRAEHPWEERQAPDLLLTIAPFSPEGPGTPIPPLSP